MGFRIASLFQIDCRSLAAFRIGIGMVLLVDLLWRLGDVTLHYSDLGILPRAELQRLFEPSWFYSIYLWHGSVAWAVFLLLLTAGCAAALTVGFQARLATIACWWLFTSLNVRNPLVLYGGDNLMRVLLFWAIFLPLGCAFSRDSTRRGPRPIGAGAPYACGVATACMLLQFLLVYWMTGMNKWNSDWFSGQALYYALSCYDYQRFAAHWLLAAPWSLEGASRLVPLLELFGAIVMLSPFATRPIRLLGVGFFVAFHLFVELTMSVGLFSWICICGWMLLLPDVFWERLVRWRRGAPPAAKDREGTARRNVGLGWPAAPRWLRTIIQTGLLLVFISVLAWNASNLFKLRSEGWFPGPLNHVVTRLGLPQSWDLFTLPYRSSIWLTASGSLDDGTTVELLPGEPAMMDGWQRLKPPNFRWQKLYRNLADLRDTELLDGFCRALTRYRQENGPSAPPVHRVDLFLWERTTPPGGEDPTVTAIPLHESRIEAMFR